MHPYSGKKVVVNCEAALQYSSNRTDGYSSREKINLNKQFGWLRQWKSSIY